MILKDLLISSIKINYLLSDSLVFYLVILAFHSYYLFIDDINFSFLIHINDLPDNM